MRSEETYFFAFFWMALTRWACVRHLERSFMKRSADVMPASHEPWSLRSPCTLRPALRPRERVVTHAIWPAMNARKATRLGEMSFGCRGAARVCAQRDAEGVSEARA